MSFTLPPFPYILHKSNYICFFLYLYRPFPISLTSYCSFTSPSSVQSPSSSNKYIYFASFLQYLLFFLSYNLFCYNVILSLLPSSPLSSLFPFKFCFISQFFFTFCVYSLRTKEQQAIRQNASMLLMASNPNGQQTSHCSFFTLKVFSDVHSYPRISLSACLMTYYFSFIHLY